MDTQTLIAIDEEEQLIAEAVDGSLEAFNQLVLRYQNIAYQHALALTGESDAAEDITQEAFLKAFRNLRGFRGGSFRAWLLKIETNTAYDLFRKAKSHPVEPLFPVDEDGEEYESPAWLEHPSTSVEAIVEQNEESQRLYHLIDGLPEIYRSVLTLVDIYEMDYQEAANALNIRIGTVKSRLARARLEIRKQLSVGSHSAMLSARQLRSTVPANG